MKIVNEELSILSGVDEEEITVSLTSKNTVHQVTFDRDGDEGIIPEGGELTFSLSKAHGPVSLKLFLHYTKAGTGGDPQYTVSISGSEGGDTFTKDYFGDFDIPVDEKEITINVAKKSS